MKNSDDLRFFETVGRVASFSAALPTLICLTFRLAACIQGRVRVGSCEMQKVCAYKWVHLCEPAGHLVPPPCLTIMRTVSETKGYKRVANMKVSVPVTLSSERKSRTKAPFANSDQPRSNSLGAGALPDAVDDLDCRVMSINMLPAPCSLQILVDRRGR